MAGTYDSDACRRYLVNYIADIKIQLRNYQIELTKQSRSTPFVSIALDQIDRCLTDHVTCQRTYLSMRNNRQLVTFKDTMKEGHLFELITTYYPTMDQVCGNHRFSIIPNPRSLFSTDASLLRIYTSID